ncbi:AAA family ATPase, partial [Streptomyces avermitilis]|uniref:AAA family ATPase n=1 Tax=Streptomyces avermitilis TaxID=33903 RepID=UPI0033AD96B8
MRLHRLDITAFGPFGGAQTVDFDDLSAAGLFLLHGPTGAGKTSVLDAVCYALYGAVPGARQSGQGMSLRSDHATPSTRTEIRLELTVAGRRLEITRQPPWARPKKRGAGTTTDKAQSRLREHDAAAGSWKDLSRSHQEIGEEITQLLGMSREQFCQVVLLPQGDFARFLRADAEARGKLLGRLFDTHRFAEVEKRLAERRRAVEAAVRDGDATLLADAHRMQQAVGDVVEVPLPDLAPGDPGLAETVLTWAAVARSTARERLTLAHCARTAAESAQAAADRVLDDVREVARLQRRFTEARERAARLEERSDAHREAQTRMERARKAEAVAPALDLRDTAEAEHRRAATDEARARTALPGTFADDGAPGLAAAARKAAEELGGLESARRAERRLGELTEERASLDRQERADDDVLQDAESWLATWEATRAGLQAGIESAQEATTRAEQLAVRRDPAQARLAAARRRDRLSRDTDEARARALAAREQATDARSHWLDLKEQRLQGIAAELAASLVEGEPCAVCGALDHPAPARKIAGHVDRETEERALTAYQRADETATVDERRLGAVREELAAATAEAGDAPTADLAQEAAELERQHTEARAAASGLHTARQRLAQAELEHERRVADQQQAALRAAARVSHRDTIDRERASLEKELAQARGGAESVAARAAQLERRTTLLTDAADAVRTAEDTAQRLKDADARLADAAFRAGFDTPGAAAAALLDDAAHRDLQRRLDAWQSEEAAVRAVLAEADTAAAARQPAADPAAAE